MCLLIILGDQKDIQSENSFKRGVFNLTDKQNSLTGYLKMGKKAKYV